MLGEADAVYHYAHLASELAKEQGFPFFLGMATQLWGWALVKKGKSREGLEKLQSGLATFCDTGAQLGLPYFALLHAEALAHTGRMDEANAKLAEGLAWIARSSERWIEPRLLELQLQYKKR